MDRRKFLLGVGGTAIGGSALVGSGAFTSVESHRTASIVVAHDENAYLGLIDLNSSDYPNASYVDYDDDGHLRIQMNADNPNEDDQGNEIGFGVNSNSISEFDNLFRVCNHGKQPVGVWFEPKDTDGADYFDRVEFYVGDDPSNGLNDVSEAETLAVGDCIEVGMRVETLGSDAAEGDQILEEMVAHADESAAGQQA